MELNATLNEVLVRLFREVMTIEEHELKHGEFKELTANDMHVIEAIGSGEKNMTTVAKTLMVTTGTLTISVNGLVKKGFVERTRSEEDRRVVLVSLTEKGKNAFAHHQEFHQRMVKAIVNELNGEEQKVLHHSLLNLLNFFRKVR